MISTLSKQGGVRAQMGNTSPIFVGRFLSIGVTEAVIPPVVAVAETGAGSGKRRRHFVDVNDQRFEVRDEAEAVDLLSRIKESQPNRVQRRAIKTAFANQPKDDFGDIVVSIKLSSVVSQKLIEMRQLNEDDEVILLLLH